MEKWMAALAAGAAALALITAGIWQSYRRQIRRICRQIAFLTARDTNLRLTSDLPFPELNELIDGINEVIDQSREIREGSRQNEARLKETVTNLSHDIRTPLTSLDGYFQLLRQGGTEEERERYIGIIESRITSLKDMLEELFTCARLQDADYRLETEPMDFGRCVYETVFSFYDEFQARGIEPEADFREGRFFVCGNEEAMRRMIQNLVKNALEHGRNKIRMELFPQDGKIIFRCSNDVEHPEEIEIDRVFGRFYKADSARTHTSTGLGLSIAKGLAERMGGRISAALEGNVFSVQAEFKTEDQVS